VLILTWALYDGQPSRLVLAVLDLFSVAALGFFWAYSEAENFRWIPTLQNLMFLYEALLLWNLLLAGVALRKGAPSAWGWVWILPSEGVSALALILLALVFLYRYGALAIPFSCVILPLYALFQRPTYSTMFLERAAQGVTAAEAVTVSQAWMLALASGKLAFGLVFYTLYFSPARDYGPIHIKHIGLHDSDNTTKWLKLAAGTFCSAILAGLASLFTDWIGRLLTKH
jgi:hypothetical protein